MPQLSQIGEIYASQLFWLAIVFALIYFGIGRAMVPRVERTIDDRHARITGDLAAAEAARATIRGAGESYEASLASSRAQAAKTVAAAQARAAAVTEEQTKAGDARSADHLATATARIDTAKHAALTQIEATTVEMVEAIVAKLSGAPIDRATVERQVRVELSHG